jgi:ribose 5-phosphate isomerase B
MSATLGVLTSYVKCHLAVALTAVNAVRSWGTRVVRPTRPYPSDMTLMRVAFAADHAGAALKDELIRRLGAAGLGHSWIDLGGDGSDPADDYPGFARRLGRAIAAGEADRGILICGSGVGASVAANKIRGIRAAVCHDTYSAHQGVEHDDMNVLTLGARVIGPEPAYECAIAFVNATFSGEPRHRRRLEEVLTIEANGR